MANSGKQLPKCKYGSQCYRTNADHRMEYWHPENLSNTRPDVAEEHSPDARPKDGGTKAVSFQPGPVFASNSSITHMLDEEIEGAPEGEQGRCALEGTKTGEINQFGPKVVRTKDELRDIPKIVKKADAGVLLLLIGVPGSGKSTFCVKLMSNAAQPWTRICQDIIAKGKRGTKKECLKHTERALGQKVSVVIDRCNIDKEQRLEFLQLAASFGVEAHGVVLNLPASVCIQRASKRIGHEGGVSAGNAGSVINRMVKTRQLPLLSEGFSRVTFCRTDMDVESVVQQYRELLPSKHLESGVFGGHVNKSKSSLQLVLEKSDQRNRGNNIDNKGHHVEKVREGQQADVVGGGKKPELNLAAWSSCRSKAGNTRDLAGSVCVEDKGTNTLAFPSISTSDFQFDLEKASSVLVDAVAKFLLIEDSKMRLILVDLKHSQMLSLVSRKAREKGLDATRFCTFIGDITRLRTSHGPDCNIIANAANWRLKAGGGGVNAAIYSAAGPELERATKQVAQTINPGTSVVVHLPESSPLHIQEGVTHVIHVLGPNMNPQRPSSLFGDYSEGCRILQSSYASLFQNFSSIVKSCRVVESSSKVEVNGTVQSSSKEEANGKTIVGITRTNEKPAKNAFTVLMQASKRNRELKDVHPKRDKVRVTEEVVARASRGTDETGHPLELDTCQSCGPEKGTLNNQPHSNLCGTSSGRCPIGVGQKEETDGQNQEGPTTAEVNQQGGTNNGKRWDDWALALYEIAMHPEQHTEIVLQITDDAIVLYDIHPKAKRHLLVVARKPALDSLENLQKEHLPVLRHMHSLGEEWAAHYLKADPSLSFRLGYHLVPSMRQVHFHLISQDFDSASLKNKKHWNSFTTSFFRDSLDLLNQLEGHGQMQNSVTDGERLLDLELRCHRCRSAHPNLSRLKQHISNCRRDLANSSFLITLQSSAR